MSVTESLCSNQAECYKGNISIGEVIDKYSILEIKSKNITSNDKIVEISKELSELSECKNYIDTQRFLYNILLFVNGQIWDLTNKIKTMHNQDDTFNVIAKSIFDFNQKRFRIKNFFNNIFSSKLNEVKSYAATYCSIMNDDNIIYSKIPEINFLSIEYDFVIVDNKQFNIYKKLFNQPNIITIDTLDEIDRKRITIIDFNSFYIDKNLINIFDFLPITYASSGKLGDFIQCLSIVNENFYKTGKKGIVYIRNNETFSMGLEYTHKDTYHIIKSQPYISEYKIFNNENIDIDLDLWFHNKQLLGHTNWYNIFNKTYDVEWGKHKWFNVDFDKKWENTVLVNIMHYRKSVNIDFKKLYSIYKEHLMFIGFNQVEYNEFLKTYDINIPLYIPESFTDCCIAVNSCKLLVASLSGILTIGHACHKSRIIGLCNIGDDIHNKEFDTIWDNVSYTV
jgi:hypothetical protein